MKALPLISIVAVVAVILPSILFLFSVITLEQVKITALIGTIVWFATAPLWIGRDKASDLDSSENPAI